MAFRAVTRRVLKETQDTQAPEYLDKRLYDFHFASAEQIVPETKPATAEQKPAKPTAVAACDGVEAQVGSERRCLKPGSGKTEWFKDCPACPEMVVVPPVADVDRKGAIRHYTSVVCQAEIVGRATQ
jgi:hypothetical protein